MQKKFPKFFPYRRKTGNEIVQVALGNSVQTMKLNLALSNALRLLHDEKEIILKNNLDSEEVWHLFPNEEHIFTSDITHIIVLEVK